MMGLEISNASKTLWVPALVLCAVLSVILGIWVGPIGVYFVSAAGCVFGGLALLRFSRSGKHASGSGVVVGILLAFHIMLLGSSFLLE